MQDLNNKIEISYQEKLLGIKNIQREQEAIQYNNNKLIKSRENLELKFKQNYSKYNDLVVQQGNQIWFKDNTELQISSKEQQYLESSKLLELFKSQIYEIQKELQKKRRQIKRDASQLDDIIKKQTSSNLAFNNLVSINEQRYHELERIKNDNAMFKKDIGPLE